MQAGKEVGGISVRHRSHYLDQGSRPNFSDKDSVSNGPRSRDNHEPPNGTRTQCPEPHISIRRISNDLCGNCSTKPILWDLQVGSVSKCLSERRNNPCKKIHGKTLR